MRVLLPLLLAAVAGCAPSADLRVPLAEPIRQSGRAAVVRVGVPDSEPDSALDARRAAFWSDLQAELVERYGFASVDVIDAPALAFDTLRVLVQNPPVGSARQGWRRRPVRLPRDPAALAPGADVVVVLDRLSLGDASRSNSVYVAGKGFGVMVPLPSGRGVGVGADVVVYRAGQAAPVGVGRVDVYGRGSGLFENRVDERAADRAAAGFAERIAVHGGFARR